MDPTDPYAGMPPEPPDDAETEDFSGPPANAPLTEVSAPGMGSSVFVHRDTGNLIRILSMNDSYVLYASLDGTGRFNMPIKDYNESFAQWWRPARAEDLASLSTPEVPIAAPASAPKDW